MSVHITGQARIADEHGTHEPGEIVTSPSPALVELAQSKALDPDTGLPYCEIGTDDVALEAALEAAAPEAAAPKARASKASDAQPEPDVQPETN